MNDRLGLCEDLKRPRGLGTRNPCGLVGENGIRKCQEYDKNDDGQIERLSSHN
jgi:hypothetical protein